ncbi:MULTISPECIES: hypothetical protein [Rummeliibacillus]|uniref:hypothetical protein n=1 Tax=Rummeliibacillus TaxID=648802 RepID=UPI0011B7CFB3|nr:MULTISPECIES: hypothetical protein [Rummeliibacillus]MBO2536704.1 hypothetical protein [Rummeliibacillus suwonensis]
MNKDSVPKDKRKIADLPYKDRPDMMNSENISIYDLHEDMHTVDPIPVEAQTKDLEKEKLDDKYNGDWTS